MLNAAHFVSPYLQGTQTFIFNYIKAFSRWNAHIFAYEFENLDQFRVDGLVRVPKYSLPWAMHCVAEKFSVSGRIDDRLILNRNNTRFVRSQLEDKDIRLIHAHFGQMGCYSLGLKRAMRLPMVTTFYGWDISFLPRVGWRERYVPLFNWGECFFVEGSHMKRCLADLGCEEEKIQIIHIGADTRAFRFKPRRLGAGEKLKFLFCGRFIEKKGLEYALRALAVVKQKYRDVEFRVIGDGPLRPDIDRLMGKLKLEVEVKLLGYLPYEKAKQEFDQAHILVQPSVTAANGETEGGAPAVLIEAQACGMPILASVHADIPEVVLHEKSGLLSEERNFEQLAEHMAFMIDHPEKWPEMGLAGRRHVEENYDIKIEAGKIEQVYTDLINRGA